MRERDYDVLSLLHRDERAMVIVSYGFESYHLLIICFGSLPIFGLDRILTYSE